MDVESTIENVAVNKEYYEKLQERAKVSEYWYLEYHKLYFELASLRDRIEQAKFFNQRAGRELWQDKPKEVQDRDIESAEKFYDALLKLIDGYKNESGQSNLVK